MQGQGRARVCHDIPPAPVPDTPQGGISPAGQGGDRSIRHAEAVPVSSIRHRHSANRQVRPFLRPRQTPFALFLWAESKKSAAI